MPRISNRNFYNDPRVRASNATDADFEVYDDDGEAHQLPTRWAVCPLCNGAGTHVNPAIDCDGLSGDDFARDPDFEEAYMAGEYDVICRQCLGRTTVLELDRQRCPADLLALYDNAQRELAECDAIQRAEMAMGA